ncbi:MAG: hypothetical protein ABEI11_02205 [Haloarculaceae archaeon]
MSDGSFRSADPTDSLDGHDVARSLDRACPSCGREYEHGDRLVVRIEREGPAAAWGEPSIVCAGCGRRSLSEAERRGGVDQALVAADAVATPGALVLDGDAAEVLDRSPPGEGT